MDMSNLLWLKQLTRIRATLSKNLHVVSHTKKNFSFNVVTVVMGLIVRVYCFVVYAFVPKYSNK